MIRDGVDVFYLNRPVASEDQAISLVAYLQRHGLEAFPESTDSVQIVMECPSKEDAADKASVAYMLMETWSMFWKYSDKGVFELPVYSKDD